MNRARFESYEAKDGFRWRLRAANGKIIAESGEAYTTNRDLNRAIRTVKAAVARIAAFELATRASP